MNAIKHTIRRPALIGLLCLLPLLSLSSSALAQAASADAAAQQAMAQTGNNGKVLSVREKKDSQGNAYFEVKVITDGNVRVVKIAKR